MPSQHNDTPKMTIPLSEEEAESIEAMKLAQLKARIKQGLADAAAGRVVDGETFFDELLRGKYDAPDDTDRMRDEAKN